MSSDLPVIHGQPVHSLETITAKLQEDPRNIDAAIAVLGASGFFHERSSILLPFPQVSAGNKHQPAGPASTAKKYH